MSAMLYAYQGEEDAKTLLFQWFVLFIYLLLKTPKVYLHLKRESFKN